MDFLLKFLIFTNAILAFIITIFIVTRRSKGGGGLTSSTNDMGNTFFGVHANIYLNRLLTILVVLFFIITLIITIITSYYY